MVQNLLSDDDDDTEEDEEHARVALVMRDAPSTTVVQELATGLPNDSKIVSPEPTGVVWAEARVEVSAVNALQGSEVLSLTQVAVVPVEIDNETVPTTIDVASNLTDPTIYSERNTSEPENAAENCGEEITMTPPAPTTCSLYRWNFIVCAVGNALLVAAASVTFTFEISAIIFYMLGAVFYYSAEGFSKLGRWTLAFQTLFQLLSIIHLSVDLILLTISTLLVELLSWIAGIVCILFGGITVGVGMHRHIRHVCQWIQTMFRKIHANWNPPRMEPYVFHDSEMNEESFR